MENIFPSCLGFAKLGVKNETQAVYQVNDDFKYHVKLLDENFYLDEYHYGNIVKSSIGKSLKEAFVNHFRNYDPLNCPIQEAWISKVTSIPFVYEDYISKEDVKIFQVPQLCFVDVRIPFDEDHADAAKYIRDTILGMKNGRCRIDQCLHLTVYPGEVIKKYIPVLSVSLPVGNVYQFLKVSYEDGIIIRDKRFRVIVSRPGIIKNHSFRIFNGGEGDDWLRYMICFEEL